MTHPQAFRGVPLAAVLLLATTFSLGAQSTYNGPYDAESFEAHRYQLGQLGGLDYLSSVNGQDGWILFDSLALTPNWNASSIQTAVVGSGAQAAKFDAALMTPGCFGELRRNAFFNLSNGVIEIEMDFLITSSSNPSAFWEVYTQPAPIPQSCQMRWFIGADGHIEYFTGPSHVLIVTNHYVTKDVWHHARTVVDDLGNHTAIYLDGVLVGSGTPIGAFSGSGVHGFTQIDVDGAGNDAFYFDNLTIRERTAPNGLWLDRPRLPINQRTQVHLHLNGGAALANRPYALLASLSGTSPGVAIGTTHLPLNPDGFMGIIATDLGSPNLPGFLGVLDQDGHGTAVFDTFIQVPAGLLGLNLDFAYLTYNPFDAASEPARTRVTLN